MVPYNPNANYYRAYVYRGIAGFLQGNDHAVVRTDLEKALKIEKTLHIKEQI